MSQTDPSTPDLTPPDANAVAEAQVRIREWVRQTPAIALKGPGARPMVLKLECMQRSGSFKLRGALNKLLSLDRAERKRGVITASGGNHGLGVAWAGWLLGVPVQVVVPSRSPAIKREALVRANAELTVIEGCFPEADLLARERAARNGQVYIHAYDDARVIAGQGTVVRELLGQAPEIKTIAVAIGGGGLAAGAGLAAMGRTVVGVEPEGIPTMHAALAAGHPVDLEDFGSVAADSLGAGRAGQLSFPLCRDGLDRVELVSDAALEAARRWLWDHVRVAAEHGAVAGLAALMEGRFDDDPGPVGIVICGGNTDPRSLADGVDPEIRPEVPGRLTDTASPAPAAEEPVRGAGLRSRSTMFATSDNLFRTVLTGDAAQTLDESVDD